MPVCVCECVCVCVCVCVISKASYGCRAQDLPVPVRHPLARGGLADSRGRQVGTLPSSADSGFPLWRPQTLRGRRQQSLGHSAGQLVFVLVLLHWCSYRGKAGGKLVYVWQLVCSCFARLKKKKKKRKEDKKSCLHCWKANIDQPGTLTNSEGNHLFVPAVVSFHLSDSASVSSINAARWGVSYWFHPTESQRQLADPASRRNPRDSVWLN